MKITATRTCKFPVSAGQGVRDPATGEHDWQLEGVAGR